MKNIRWKLIAILAVLVIFSAVGVYPILAEMYHWPSPGWLQQKQLKLGLDLKGGVHLVLRVQRDDAIRLESETEAERLRDTLRTRNIPFTSINTPSISQIRVEGIPPAQDAAFRDASADLSTNFDRSPGTNGTYTFNMKPNVQNTLRTESVTQALQTIERRVNELGVAEPQIAEQGQNGDEILVQLPGVTDVQHAKEIIRSTGLLELKIVEAGPASTKEELGQNGVPPEGMEIIPGSADTTGGGTVYYMVRRAAAVSGRDITNARPAVDQNNLPSVSFTLSGEGARKFATVTETNIGRRLAIILDNRVMTAPTIQSRITDNGQITGVSRDEVNDISLVLKSGALPVNLTYLEERTIGPSLGADSIRSGVTASIVGLLLIVMFMLVYYKLSGVNAIVALIFNLIILLGLMAYIGAVMTLPGIAGFVLTMGIGVDSNVLIFERIKEELEAQHGVRASINAGFSRVFLTLLDTHISALIAALFLIQFGTGPIRGFAYTLIIGLASNLFTSTFVSKTLFEWELSRRTRGQQQVATLSI